MTDKIIMFISLLIAVIIGSFGSLFLKLGSEKFNIKLSFKGLIDIIKNWRLILGVVFYGLSAVFFIYALRLGELSVVYPLTSLSYILITILSALILKERINIYKIFGILFIVGGVVLVTL